jgi:hypothetical protein
MLLGDTAGLVKPLGKRPTAISHRGLEDYLGRYSGLMLYLREMDETIYSKLCAVGSFYLSWQRNHYNHTLF